jgi:hypothetical protein
MNLHSHKSSLQSMPQARNIIKHHGHARHPYPQLVIKKGMAYNTQCCTVEWAPNQ